MPRRDYRNLSDFEFEDLVADLLHVEFGSRFERFGPGPDGGIDLRSASGAIVQCKHYPRARFSGLLRELRREVSKVERLMPPRYYVVTSQELTVAQKSSILTLFAPHIRSTADVLGSRDIDGLLTAHPQVEREHVKLWLSGGTALDALMHSDVYERSRWLTEQIRLALPAYVHTSGFVKARDILGKHRVCVIAGPPGIGKTTIARMLLLDGLADAFTPFEISEDIREAWSVVQPTERQMFYYDDFLGQTDLGEKMGKNEDKRLSSFIEKIARDPTKRLILTTREYVLKQAKERYEYLGRIDLSRRKFILELDAYSRLERAKILYNHLFHSELPREAIRELVRTKTHYKIIEHSNYSPRLIEAIASTANATLPAEYEEFPSHAIELLDNPQLIWSAAFSSHIDDVGRAILLVLATLPPGVLLEDLAKAVESFLSANAISVGIGSFQRALSSLEATFVRIDPSGPNGADRSIRFHNPSVSDFVLVYLSRNGRDLQRVLGTAVFFEQIERIWSLTGRTTIIGTQKQRSVDLRSRALESTSLLTDAITRTYSAVMATGGHVTARPSLSARLRIAAQISATAKSARLTRWVSSRAADFRREWSTGLGSPGEGLALFTRLIATGVLKDSRIDQAGLALKRLLTKDLSSISDFNVLVQFSASFPRFFTGAEWDSLAARFESVARDELSYSSDDLQEAEDAAHAFGVDLDDDIEAARERAEPEPEYDWDDVAIPPVQSGERDAAIDIMFDRLAS